MTSLLTLHYRLINTASNNTPIMLLHGLFGSLDNLNTLARELQKSHPIVQVDLRNHGLSPHSAQMDYPLIAHDLLALLNQLALPEIILIGHSMGGKAAMALCALAGQRVQKLIVLDIAPVAYPEHQQKTVFAALNAVTQAGVTQRNSAQNVLCTILEDEKTALFLLKSFHQGKWRFNLSVLEERYSILTGWNQLPPWQGLSLFIKGEQSTYLQEQHHDAIIVQFPLAHFSLIANAGHWVHAEKPQAVLQAISAFLTDPLFRSPIF